MNEFRIESWAEFEDKISQLAAGTDAGRSGMLFRGHSDSTWPLDTTLERTVGKQLSVLQYYRLVFRSKPQIDAFTGSSWPLPKYDELNALCNDYDSFHLRGTFREFPASEFMVYLRHHGFPSPLLDWTRSPYIAAFFALRQRSANDPALFVYMERPRMIKSWSSDESTILPFRSYNNMHRRHFLQQSSYTVCLKFEQSWQYSLHEMVFNRQKDQDVLYKFVIPAAKRLDILEMLDRYNLNSYSLFGTEESLMETIALREIELDL